MCVDLLNRLADAVFRRRRLTGLLKVVVGLVVALSMGAAARAQRPFQVVTTADGGPGSLRQAITDANTGTGGSITFNIPTTDPGFDLPGSPNAWRIALGSPLPPIQRTTILNGLTQPGSACSSPRIEIRPATGASFTGDGIAILANDCAVRGLVINGFVDNGVSLTTATGCTVSCNFIGTDVTGTVLIGNGTGVLIANGVMNVIGGTEAGTANLVAGNVGIGVSVVTSGVPSNVGNSILRNSIRSNGALGIDLAANGVTDNDPLDLDVGPNHFQNYPVITGFVGGTISAVLDSLPNRRFRVEFFANSSQDPSNFGEGAQFIDALEVVSSAGGSANLSLPYTPGPGIRYVTATATSLPPLRSGDPGGESSDGFGLRGVAPAAPTGTSEFSRAFLVAAGANTPPVAQPVTVTTPEDTDVTVTLVATDVDGQLLAYRITGLPGAGQLLQFGSLTPIAATGTIVTDAQHRVVYRPPLNASGSPLTTFTYVANDGEADSNTTTVTVNVTPVNDPPAAADDVYATNEDTPLTVSTRALGVLGNDTDPEAPPQVLTAVLVTTTSHGSLTFNANGTFTYSPQPNFNGVDSFTYRASDGTVQSGVATATINVGPINDPPVARNDSYLTNEDVALTVSAPGVLLNDSDIDNDINAATVTIVAQPASGTLSNVAAGGFRYTPNLNFNGTDTFTYRLNDGAANSNIATVSIIVQPLNDPPVAADDAYSTNEDTGLVVATRAAGVLGNDTDPEGTTLSAVLVTTTSHGTLALAGDGSFNYAPAPNFNGADSFTYRASDGSAQSNTATVTIAVRPANDPPIATDDTYTTSEDTSLTVSTTAAGVLGNDFDADSDPLSAVLVGMPLHGSLSLAADGTFVYAPAANYNGPDTFTYRANDGTANSGIATVRLTITAVNDPPVAVDDAYTGDEDTPITIASAAAGVLGNDTDPENDTLTAAVVTPPSHGAVVLNASGTFTYTPAADYNGADSFTYRARDAALDSNTATVRITLRGVNDPPVAVNDAYSTNEDTPLTIAAANLGVLANDTDPDVPAQTLTAILVSTTTRGTLTFNGNGTFTYSPQPNFNGADTFTYRASDGAAQSNIATVTITVSAVNDPPVARNDSYFTNEDTALTVPPPGVLVNDSDVDNDINAAIVTIVVQPTSGVLSNVAAGGFRYTPNSNFTGTDTFTYRLSDGAANSNIATVSIIVQALNDPPIAVDDSYTTAEDTPLSVAAPGVLGNDTDPDSPPSSLSAQLVSPPLGAAFALNPNGSFSYTPSPEFNGDVTFTYRVSDGAATSAPATVTIHVTPVNDAPVAVDDAYTAAPNTPLTINAPGVLGNDFDIDSASLTAALAMPPVHGSVVLAAAGGFVYTPATDYTGPDAFTYRASDGALSSNIATVSITIVAGGNLPPIARCRDVTIDARHTCPDSFSVTPEDVNNGSSDPDDPTKSLVLTLSSKGPFGIGVTEVTLTVTDPHGASSTCTARITVLGEDCNNNGAPDACDIGSGGSADCNHDGVPDECQCLWDNGMGTPASDGRYSQLGGRSQTAPKVADDFYIEPGQVCHVATFTGQMLTNLAPARRQARLEFYEDCDGAPAGDPIAVFANSTVLAAEPAVGPGGSGYFLVTFSFDLCSANLWLDGGKTYWVSLYALATCSDSSQSYWAAAPGAMRGSVPHVAMGHPSPTQCTTVRYDPWLTGETCCGDCENLAFKLGGAVCPIIWDNGPYWHCPGGGGLISGRVGAYQSRSADNFVIKPCDDQTICFLEATIWTNGNPATGFVEIYANDCKQPADRLFTATVSRAIPTGQTLRLGGVDVQAYVLQFYDLGWTLPAGRTYWLSAGATCAGGSINQRAYFAIADMCGTDCNIKISPAWMGNVGVGGTVMWCPKHEDLAFRIAALPGVVAPAHHSQPLATCPVDLDGDGHAGVQDLFAYLTAWFAGCP